MILPITLTTAGAAAILNLWLAMRAGRVRMASKVSIGDGGHAALTARMRAHANFVEYAPFIVILIGLIELAGGNANLLWGASILFILARIAHAFGMDVEKVPNPLRAGGILVTFLLLIGLAGWALSIPYTSGTAETGTEVVPMG